MKIEQIYTGCLAQGAYYIESEGEAAVIDPLRETEPYIKMAEKDGAKIKYILETHFHADFVSGHVSLAKETGATIVFGPGAEPAFPAHIAEDGEILKLGAVTIEVLHTPGHTMESTCYLLRDAQGKEVAIFTGDTLFLGDVGRPDLAQKAASMTQEELAGLLYDSLRNKIMPLSDELTVYPAHGAGSACGKNMMKETVDTLGNQKVMNYALRADMTKDEFVEEVLDGLAPPPAYFPDNVRLNKQGYEDLNDILAKAQKSLTPEEFQKAAKENNALILDVRNQNNFSEGHVPGSIFIGIDGQFAPWVGELVKDVNTPILLVVDEGREEEVITRLSRVGFDNVIGELDGGMESWKAAGLPISTLESISPEDLAKIYPEENSRIFDVRKPGEYDSEHLVDVKNTPLSNINEHMSDFPRDKAYVHCAGGYRSVIAASIMKSRGIDNVINILEGWSGLKNTDLPKQAQVCQNS